MGAVKLTLSVDPEVVAAAKRFAAQRGTSVSRLVERYLQLVAAEPAEPDSAPVLTRLRATLRGASATVDDHHAHLVRKYS